MILSIRSEYTVGEIRTGLCKSVFRKDEECRWKIGADIQFWYLMPNDAGAYEFARGKVEEIKDVIYYPEKNIITVIDSSNNYKHLKTYQDQENFIKGTDFDSISRFKEKKQKHFESRIIYWNTESISLTEIRKNATYVKI